MEKKELIKIVFIYINFISLYAVRLEVFVNTSG